MRILVTGASGFVGGHVVEALLKEGYKVRGTVRDTESKNAEFLRKFDGDLELVNADLNDSESLDKAVEGCEVVVHTASPVMDNAKDPQKELVDPAVNGTRNVVAACKKHGVRRIVATSSAAVIEGDWKRKELFDETCRNTVASLSYGAYAFSKVQAEKVLEEEWAGEHEYCSVHPTVIWGPQQNPRVTSSNQILSMIFLKEMPLLMPMRPQWVDVRDVARMHVLLATKPDVKGRYICTQPGHIWLADVAKVAKAHRPQRSFPSWTMPYSMVYLVSFFDTRISNFLLDALFRERADLSNKMSIEELGFDYKFNLESMVKDTLDSYEEHGILK